MFEQAFGHYEARVKFPAINATWGAFWLMYSQGSQQRGIRSARIGSEIDLIETAANPTRSFNAASHWNGYTYDHGNPTNHLFGTGAANRNRNINWLPGAEPMQHIGDIYDGEWHTFAVSWTPTDYIFYVNDIEWARRSRPETYQWGGSTDPNVDQGWGWGGLIGPHMLDDPRHFAGVAENPNYIKLSVEAADWSGLGTEGPGLASPCTAPGGSCEDCIFISDRNDVTNGLGWHRVEEGEMIVDWVKVWNGPKPEAEKDPCRYGHTAGDEIIALAPTCTEEGVWEIRCTVCEGLLETGAIDADPCGVCVICAVPFAGTSPSQLNAALAQEDAVIINTPGSGGYGIAAGATLVVPADKTLYVSTILNVRRDATLRIEGTVVILESGRLNSDGHASSNTGTIVIASGGKLVNEGYVEIAERSTLTNNGTITNDGRFEIRKGVVYSLGGIVDGARALTINRDAVIIPLT